MRPRPLPSAIFAFLVALMTLGVATAASADDSITASDDAYSTVHDVTLTKNANDGVLFNDTDTFGNPQVALDQDVAHGSLTLGTDGAVSYSPDAAYVGPDSFTYHLTDVDQNSDPVSSNVATVTISVTNADPSAGDDSYSMTQGQTLMEDANDGVLSNDSDADGDAITAQRLTDVSHGTLTFNSDGSFTYTPNAPFFGTDHFTYEADDAFGGTSDPAMVTITVNPPDNSPPTADDDSYSTSQGTELDVDAPGVLSNDTDPDGDTLSAAKVGPGPSHGTLTFNSDGSFTYTPNAPFQGTDHFTYQASDGHGGTSDPATVTITVNAASNSPPTATDDSYAVTQGQTLTKDAAHGVLANDTDPDGDTLTAAKVGNGPSHGTLDLNSDGSFTYTPNAQFQGTDHFTYQASDGHGGTSDPATVTITVNPPDNSPPTADDDSYSTGQGTEIDVNVANGVLANDTDPDGDTLSATKLTGPSHGTLDLDSDGSFTYTPNAQFFGTDHFTYQASDGHGGTSDPATVTISVNAKGNAPPTGVDDGYSMGQGTTLHVGAAHGVLANDTDPDGDTMSATKLT
ncbi:MAG TPA: Ig-like domain-containing protein, partial [Actinomycetota bacterium]